MKVYVQITLIYALIVLIGGVIGFIKAQSMASLAMSLFFAGLLSISSWLMLNNRRIGYYLALGCIGFLAFFFLYRFVITVKIMPAGLMSLVSMFAAMAFAHYRKKLGEPNGH